MQLSIYLTISRSLLAVVLLTSSLPKLRATSSFAGTVQAYHLLPSRWVRPFALSLPWLELALGLLLLLGWHTRIAALTSAALLLVFLAAMGINLARGRKDLDCGCAGKKHAQKIGWQTMARNSLLGLLCLPLAMWGGGFLALDHQSPAVQAFVREQVLLNMLLPLGLIGVGLWLLARLLRQTVRLVLLSPVENQISDTPTDLGSFKPISVEVQP